MHCLRQLSQSGLSKEWTARSSVPQTYVSGIAKLKMLFGDLIIVDIISVRKFCLRRKIDHDDVM